MGGLKVRTGFTGLGIVLGTEFKGDIDPGDRWLVQRQLDEHLAGRKRDDFRPGDRTVRVVFVDLKGVLPLGGQIGLRTALTLGFLEFRHFALGERRIFQRQRVIADFDIERRHARHTAIGGNDVDTVVAAQIVFTAVATGETGHTAHDDTFTGFVAGVFQSQPGRRIGQRVIQNGLAPISTPVVVVLDTEIGGAGRNT